MAKTMKALMYDKAGRENSSVRQIPYPECGDDEVIIKVMSCSICKGAEHDHDKEKVLIWQNIQLFRDMNLQDMFMKLEKM